MILVVGAGLSGATVARVLAEAGKRVAVIDRRGHLAGNAFDYVDTPVTDAVRIHHYGPHIFHTKNREVWEFLSDFTVWLPYEHRVRALLWDGLHVPFPPNDDTRRVLKEEGEKYGVELDPVEVFYRPYTEKMWGRRLEDVNPKILERVPGREGREDRYFPDDPYQAMPMYGYTNMVSSMLAHPNIRVQLGVKDYRVASVGEIYGDWVGGFPPEHIFTSEAIDEYFGFSLGELPYRSLKFTTVRLPVNHGHLLPATTCNYTGDGPYTRVTEWRQFPNSLAQVSSGLSSHSTVLTFEEPYSPKRDEEKYYPVVDKDSRALYKQYSQMVPKDVTFIGRLGNFAYIDMDQAVNSALASARKYLSGQTVGNETLS